MVEQTFICTSSFVLTVAMDHYTYEVMRFQLRMKGTAETRSRAS